VLLSLSVGCKEGTGEPSADFPVKIGSVTIGSAPQKVVSLSPSVTEVIYTLGAYARLCGVSDYCEIPEDGSALPRLGTQINPDTDKVIALGADLVLSGGDLPQDALERLAVQKINVLIVPPVSSLDFERVLMGVSAVLSGNLTGAQNARMTAQRLNASIDAVIAEIENPVVSAVLFLPGGAVATGDTYAGSLLARAMAVNIAANASGYQMTREEVARAAPEVIICPANETMVYKTAPDLKETPAVKNGAVYGVNTILFERQGERAVEAVKTLADLMYKETQSSSTEISNP
jgi:iron complex transport system substrate-binding protein